MEFLGIRAVDKDMNKTCLHISLHTTMKIANSQKILASKYYKYKYLKTNFWNFAPQEGKGGGLKNISKICFHIFLYI